MPGPALSINDPFNSQHFEVGTAVIPIYKQETKAQKG